MHSRIVAAEVHCGAVAIAIRHYFITALDKVPIGVQGRYN